MTPRSLRFSERMSGFVAFGEPDCERGLAMGRGLDNRLAVRLTILIDDLDRLEADPARESRIEGWIGWEALGGRLPVEQGQFNLLVPSGEPEIRVMRYRLRFRDGVGHPFTLHGEKRVGGSGRRVWAQTTTLFCQVWRGWDDLPDAGERVAAGMLRLGPLDFARQLTTFRASGNSVRERLATIARYDRTFLRLVRDAYPSLGRGRTSSRDDRHRDW